MKIAILADPLDTQNAGIHVFCKELIASLLTIDKQNQYYIVRAKESDDFPNATELIFPINKKIPFHNRFRQFTSIPKRLRDLNVDAVLELAHFGPFGLGDEIKKITFIHDLTPIIYPSFHSKLSVLMHKNLLPHILNKVDLIFCNSKATQTDLLKYFPVTIGKSQVAYLGCNKSFKPTLDKTILRKYNITKPYFLSVGTLEPRKNLTTLLEAWTNFKEKGGNEILVLTGSNGWNYQPLINKINANKFKSEITLTGFVPESELPSLYSQAKAMVYSSFYEGFGLPVLEAMACGCPVIISDNSALPEVGGTAAYYFNPNKSVALEAILTKTSTLDLQDAKNRSLAQANKFKWENTASIIKAGIENLFN